MSKGKLKKFNENLSFKCLYQPAFDDVFNSKFDLCGKWAQTCFNNSNPIVLELGCGYGEYTIALAKKFPNKNFIGVDIKGARIWRGAKTVTEEQIPNAAFIRARIECITNLFGPGEVSEIWLTFPDPQIKRSRSQKRLTSPGFLSKYAKMLSPCGIIHLKTDSLHLYEYTRAVLRENFIDPICEYDDIYATCHDDDLLTIKTHYEQLSLDFGVSIKYLSWTIPTGENVDFSSIDFYADMEEGTLDDDRPKPGKRKTRKRPVKIDLDEDSGCCFGVVRAIERAEQVIAQEGSVASLGDLVHNPREMERLRNLGLKIISHEDIENTPSKILVRAHGEPPSTFNRMDALNHPYVDATCPVVKSLQNKIKTSWEEIKKVNGQIVLFGKKGHAEVIGLAGQTDGEAIVIEKTDDLKMIDFSRPISVFSQTTQSVDQYHTICEAITSKSSSKVDIHETICHSVSGRVSNLQLFAKNYDVVIFVAGHNSSNGKALFEKCLNVNSNSHLVDSFDEIDLSWFTDCQSVGICGATSTPRRQMEEIKTILKGKLASSCQ